MKIIPEIPVKFPGQFPLDYQNTIQHWGFFSRQEIKENEGKLLMLDIDFGRQCSLRCSSCFRRKNIVDNGHPDLSYNELLAVIDDARQLGLRNVKICGAGEPTENSMFLQFVRDMTERGIGVACFTKGQVLGSDIMARKVYGSLYAESAMDLCEQLAKFNVSFMLSFQSFNTEIQDKIVSKKGHALVRNQALLNLVNAGFADHNPTRLALHNGPITPEIYSEAYDIYRYAQRRNLCPITTITMISGKQFNQSFLKRIDISAQQKIELWTKIYSWNIRHGIQTLAQIQEEGISAMPGIHPCNQVACGLYLTANGNVVGCPGFTQIEGNVHEKSIAQIWEESQNRKRAGMFNCKCPPKDGKTIPLNLYKEVLKRLEEKYS